MTNLNITKTIHALSYHCGLYEVVSGHSPPTLPPDKGRSSPDISLPIDGGQYPPEKSLPQQKSTSYSVEQSSLWQTP